MSLSSVGKIDVFADTGLDQWEFLRKRVREEVEKKKIHAGQIYFMPIHFDEPLMIKITVEEMPQKELL